MLSGASTPSRTRPPASCKTVIRMLSLMMIVSRVLRLKTSMVCCSFLVGRGMGSGREFVRAKGLRGFHCLAPSARRQSADAAARTGSFAVTTSSSLATIAGASRSRLWIVRPSRRRATPSRNSPAMARRARLQQRSRRPHASADLRPLRCNSKSWRWRVLCADHRARWSAPSARNRAMRKHDDGRRERRRRDRLTTPISKI